MLQDGEKAGQTARFTLNRPGDNQRLDTQGQAQSILPFSCYSFSTILRIVKPIPISHFTLGLTSGNSGMRFCSMLVGIKREF